MKKIATVTIASIASLLLITLIATTITSTYADTPNEPHAADAMWVEPSSVTFTASNATVDQKFNVTIWLNMTESIFSYQVGIYYNRTLLMCTRAKYTGGTTAQYVSGHTTITVAAAIDNSAMGNGSVLAFESCYAGDNVTGPNSGSLIWAEFQILTVPSSGSYTAKFDITTENLPAGAGNEWITDASGVNYLAFTTYDGNYIIIIPEFSYLLILPILAVSTTLAVAFSKKIRQKSRFSTARH